MNNFDRIKAMSVEEMVEFLRDIQHEMFCSCQDECLPVDDECLIYPDNSPGWKKYLESEVSE